MSLTADVVVIGGGVNGTSTAFHLAKRGVHVTLLERSTLAGGATGKSGALVRMHYTDPYDSALAQESLSYFQRWAGRGRTRGSRVPPGRSRPSRGARYDERFSANVEMFRGLASTPGRQPG